MNSGRDTTNQDRIVLSEISQVTKGQTLGFHSQEVSRVKFIKTEGKIVGTWGWGWGRKSRESLMGQF